MIFRNICFLIYLAIIALILVYLLVKKFEKNVKTSRKFLPFSWRRQKQNFWKRRSAKTRAKNSYLNSISSFNQLMTLNTLELEVGYVWRRNRLFKSEITRVVDPGDRHFVWWRSDVIGRNWVIRRTENMRGTHC